MHAHKYRAYAAELIGTFILSFGLSLSLFESDFLLNPPIIAGLIVGVLVYAFGPISGTHLNPAVTIGLLSINKIKWPDAVAYIVSQLLGGLLCFALLHAFNDMHFGFATDSALVGLGEIVGAFILLIGISSVALGKTPEAASGLTIGCSLSVAILLASLWSNGILNPAVALGTNSLSLMYVFGPCIGAILGCQAYKALSE
jgi:glycerol uptake facilitator-like aquaporin